MFDNSSIMVLLNDGNENPVQLLEVDKPTQMAICSSFAEAAVPLLSGKQIVTFNGSYKPNEDEVLFHLPEIISDAIRNPLGLQTFSYDKDAEPDIRAVFVGERTEADNTEIFTVAFQRFRKEQYLSTKKFSLFFEENTFKRETRWGIGKASKIKRLAKNCGLEITVENEKIVIPADKKKLKEILGFLDEEVYKGVFTEDTYITNSKRKMQ